RLEGSLEALGLLDRDHSILADLLHCLGNEIADFLVVVRRDRADLGDLLLARRRGRDGPQVLDHGLDGALDAPLELHGVGARGDVLEALAENCLREHGGRGGAVAGEIAGLGRDLLHHLSAHVLDRIGQLDFLGHGNPVLGDRGRAEFLVDDDIAALGTEGDLHRLSQMIDALLELGPGIYVEQQLLCSHANLLAVESGVDYSLARTSEALMMMTSSPSSVYEVPLYFP